jgi:hypothetical protein
MQERIIKKKEAKQKRFEKYPKDHYIGSAFEHLLSRKKRKKNRKRRKYFPLTFRRTLLNSPLKATIPRVFPPFSIFLFALRQVNYLFSSKRRFPLSREKNINRFYSKYKLIDFNPSPLSASTIILRTTPTSHLSFSLIRPSITPRNCRYKQRIIRLREKYRYRHRPPKRVAPKYLFRNVILRNYFLQKIVRKNPTYHYVRLVNIRKPPASERYNFPNQFRLERIHTSSI